MKLELKHITPYLPYGLKYQYQGVTNLEEIKKYNKTKPKDDFWNLRFDWETNKPKAIIGNRIGVIKEIKFYKEYTTIHFGIYHGYLKTLFFEEIKPILRPLSDLVKNIEIDGEKFVPIDKLEEMFGQTIFPQLPMNCQSYILMQKLFEWHFDVFGLIPEGIAIDINEQQRKLK
jgi:hypothetical protein